MTLYSVRNWNDIYENNRSRELKHIGWVPIPNKQDGDGYTEMVSQQDGAGLYGCWIGVVLVASKCNPRGTLLRENGEPHTAESIARLSHLPAPVIGRTLVIAVRIKWLDAVPYEIPVSIPQEGAVESHPCAVPSVPFPSVPFISERGPGKTKSTIPPVKDLPDPLNTARMRNKWEVWATHRRAFKKPKSDWPTMFNEQIDWLATHDEPTAFEILSTSIRNGWQGLFPLKETYGNRPNNRSPGQNPRNAGIVKGPTDYAAAANRKAAGGAKTPLAGSGDQAEHTPPPTQGVGGCGL